MAKPFKMSVANVSGKAEEMKASPDPSKAGTRENLNTTFGAPKEDK